MKDTLIEIKNNLRGNKSRWMKLRIKSMSWNIRKQKTTNQNNKKKEESKKKNEDSVAASETTSSILIFAS